MNLLFKNFGLYLVSCFYALTVNEITWQIFIGLAYGLVLLYFRNLVYDWNLSKTRIFFSWSNLQSFPYFNPSNLRDRNFTVYLYLNSQLVTSNQKQIISGCYCITAVYCWKPKKVCVQTLVDFFFFLLQLTSLCKHRHVESFWPKPKITWFSLHCVWILMYFDDVWCNLNQILLVAITTISNPSLCVKVCNFAAQVDATVLKVAIEYRFFFIPDCSELLLNNEE